MNIVWKLLKIKFELIRELKLLKEKSNLLKKTYYPDTQDEFNSNV